MKSRFKWYFPVSDKEHSEIWDKGIVTFDANVLLDLYRFHESTRVSILSAIESFGGRVWISHQAAEEFFRNRKTVIAGSEKDFREGTSALEEMRKTAVAQSAKLRSNRLIDRTVIADLENAMAASISQAADKISLLKEKHPNFLKEDPILDKIVGIFDGNIGEQPKPEDVPALLKEGERRLKEKIPPGFLDDGKDGARPYGDFLLWRQTLDRAKEIGAPIILVTSERKEDWWEKHSGKTVGPRIEMMREASEYAGQRILIYQTETFIEAFAVRTGGKVSAESMAEIREVSANRRASPAVAVNQEVHVCDTFENTGTLSIEVLRPVFSVTGTGKLEPNMVFHTDADVSVFSAPENSTPFVISSGSGTTHNFNVHIHSKVKGEALSVGTYVIHYSLNALDGIFDDLDDLEDKASAD